MVGLVEFVSLIPILFAASPVRLDVEGTCPDEASIAVELAAIVASREDAPPPTDTARVTTRDDLLVVSLSGADGALLGERQLRAEGDCDSQARAVAVILATFLTDLHPEYLTLLPAAPAPAHEDPVPDSDVAEPDSPAPSAAPAAAPSAENPVAPAPSPPPSTSTKTPASRPIPNEWLLTASAGAVMNSELVPAGSISLSFIRGGGALGLRAFGLVSGAADREIGGFVASFTRFPAGIGPLVRLGRRHAWVDATAGVALGWLQVAGRTFATNTSENDWVVGPFASLRAGTEWLGVRPFLEAGALAWPGESVLVSNSPDASEKLPVLDGFFVLGAGYAL